jgi:hypothetical protein
MAKSARASRRSPDAAPAESGKGGRPDDNAEGDANPGFRFAPSGLQRPYFAQCSLDLLKVVRDQTTAL